MKKSALLLIYMCVWGGQALAQNPKWFKKARKAQISIMTFDEKGTLLQSGNGFYVDEKGTALTNYDLFKNAAQAKVVDADGHESEVDLILGASSLYDVVKIRVKTNKKTSPLTLSGRMGVKNEHVYILPYPTKEKAVCLNDTLKEIQKFNSTYGYYTLSREANEKYESCPVMDEEGEVLGMIQLPAAGSKQSHFAISATYANSLQIHALSASDNDLKSIGIRKGLPAEENEAATFIYMAGAVSDSLTYNLYLNDYISQFPESANGYTQRADFYMAHGNYEAAEADFDTAMKTARQKDEVYYSFSKMLYELNLKKDYKVYKDWDMQKSLTLAQEAERINPLPLYTLQQGNSLYVLKDYEKAYEKYIALTRTNMRSADLFLYAAQCKSMLQADTLQVLALQDSAVACFTKPYIKAAAPALLARANTRLQLGMYREAVIDMNDYEHLMREEVNAYFYYLRQQAEMRCRMYQQALDDIGQAIKLDRNEPLYHAEKAIIHYHVGEYEQAIKAARNAIELKADFADCYRIIGICMLSTDQREEGLKNLRRAAELGDEAAQNILNQEAGK